MKVAILAGGLGTRLMELTKITPKPMVEIGGIPILMHIINRYIDYGYNDFIICGGYKSIAIKKYFRDYMLETSSLDFEVSSSGSKMTYLDSSERSFKVKVIDTGLSTLTGGRLKRIVDYIDTDLFHFTYGDGVADIDIQALVDFHKSHGKLATMTTAAPPGRFGQVDISDNCITGFSEKRKGSEGFVNAGFFVLSKSCIELIEGDSTIWEREPLETLARQNQLMSFKHDGFWQPMDSLKDQTYLQSLWESGAPWIK